MDLDAWLARLESVDAGTWIAAASAAVALLSLFANWLMLRRQAAIQLEEVRAAVDAEKLAWFRAALEAFAELKALVEGGAAAFPGAEFAQRRALVQERLSALADEGRLYFPNAAETRHGAHKEAAYRGRRQAALDAVLVAHDFAADLAGREGLDVGAAKGLLFDARRLFVSEVQVSIDPRRRAVMLAGGRRAARRVAGEGEGGAVVPLLLRLRDMGGGLRSFQDHRHHPDRRG